MDFRKTADKIQAELLQEISDSYEKGKGYFLWDVLKAVAIQIKKLLERLQLVAQQLDVSQLSGSDLDRFISQRTGLVRKEATFATGVLTVTGNGTVSEGDLFETEGLVRYSATETVVIVSVGRVKVQAVLAGASGNTPAGTVIKIPITIPGISACTNSLAMEGGYDTESDSDYLARYYERIRMPATSGNRHHYRRWALEVPGVGDAKVFPLWAGHNTVKVVIIDQERLPPSAALVKSVQEYIDPGITGTGAGEAPIGAFCTIEGAMPKTIDVSVRITLLEGYGLAVVIKNIQEELAHYFASIAFQKNYLSYAIIGANILNAEGVADYSLLSLNGIQQNIECMEHEVMVLGRCNISEA